MKEIEIINGPNLNLLGKREPSIYGSQTLESINQDLESFFSANAQLTFFQSNHEGKIIDYIQEMGDLDGLVINPGALTHSSIALRDALLLLDMPIIEVHISNIFAREEFRKDSIVSDIARGIISGLGPIGYQLAIEALLKIKPEAKLK